MRLQLVHLSAQELQFFSAELCRETEENKEDYFFYLQTLHENVTFQPPIMHLSSGFPSNVTLLMWPRRLLSSRPTSLLHCSMVLKAPGGSLLDSLSLSSCTSSGGEELLV